MFRVTRKLRSSASDKAYTKVWSLIPQLIFTIFISMLVGFLLFLLIDRIFEAKNAVAPFGILFGLIMGWLAAIKLYKNAMGPKEEKLEEELKQDK